MGHAQNNKPWVSGGGGGARIRVMTPIFTSEEDFGNFFSNLGTPSAVTIYSMYLRLNFSTTHNLKF